MTGKKTILSRGGIAFALMLVLGLLAPTSGAAGSPASPSVAPEPDGNAVVQWNRTAADAAARFAGDVRGNVYSRYTNPTVRAF